MSAAGGCCQERGDSYKAVYECSGGAETTMYLPGAIP